MTDDFRWAIKFVAALMLAGTVFLVIVLQFIKLTPEDVEQQCRLSGGVVSGVGDIDPQDHQFHKWSMTCTWRTK